MTANRNIGGSILPSNSPEILQPIQCAFGQLQVVALPGEDTHGLFLTNPSGAVMIAKHPNGFSSRSLADRMAKGDIERVKDQSEYITRCGGKVMAIEEILNLISQNAK